MRNIRKTLIIINITIICSITSTSLSYALRPITSQSDTPFSIEVEPDKITAIPGDEIDLRVSIITKEGFSEPIDLELWISGLGFNVSIDLGTLDPPYSDEITVTVKIPPSIPKLNAQGLLRGTSGEHVAKKYLEINLQGNSEIVNVIRQIWEAACVQANELFRAARESIQRVFDTIRDIWSLHGNNTGTQDQFPR